ncbi:M23 family metallopeptidase [Candidatus Parcubacteria bacterium]|nr:M23 family metallopeptidase [Candidatus Parcubacteria bacterium]
MANKFFIIMLAVAFLTIGIIFPHHADAKLLAPDIQISSNTFSQGDTMMVVIKNEPAGVVGRLGAVKLRFFRNEDDKDWVAIVGIPVHKDPGNYRLLIRVAGKAAFDSSIAVKKRNFPITVLAITRELAKKGYTAKKIVTTVQNDENKQLNKVLNVITPVSYVSKPFTYPLQMTNVMGEFGDIRKSGKYSIQHMGVDLQAPVGTPVYAINDGKVVFVKKGLPDYGDMMVVDHGLGVYSLYLHLSQFNFKEGDWVNQQDTIALSGATGYVTGPHLHFAVKVRGSGLDPWKFVTATKALW